MFLRRKIYKQLQLFRVCETALRLSKECKQGLPNKIFPYILPGSMIPELILEILKSKLLQI
jgi:hypothetical protein